MLLFSSKKIIAQANLRQRRMGRRRLASIIYVGQASRCTLSGLTYDDPPLAVVS
jgi:hypothetical protein